MVQKSDRERWGERDTDTDTDTYFIVKATNPYTRRGGGGVKKFGNFGKRAGDQEVNTQKEISASTRKSNIFYFWSGSSSLFQRVGAASWNDFAPERFMCVLTELRDAQSAWCMLFLQR